MKTILITLCAAIALSTAAVACHSNEEKPAQGPLERAGKKVDDTASKAADDAKDAKDTVKEKAKDAGL